MSPIENASRIVSDQAYRSTINLNRAPQPDYSAKQSSHQAGTSPTAITDQYSQDAFKVSISKAAFSKAASSG